jgi:hypothetical protein
MPRPGLEGVTTHPGNHLNHVIYFFSFYFEVVICFFPGSKCVGWVLTVGKGSLLFLGVFIKIEYNFIFECYFLFVFRSPASPPVIWFAATQEKKVCRYCK